MTVRSRPLPQTILLSPEFLLLNWPQQSQPCQRRPQHLYRPSRLTRPCSRPARMVTRKMGLVRWSLSGNRVVQKSGCIRTRELPELLSILIAPEKIDWAGVSRWPGSRLMDFVSCNRRGFRSGDTGMFHHLHRKPGFWLSDFPHGEAKESKTGYSRDWPGRREKLSWPGNRGYPLIGWNNFSASQWQAMVGYLEWFHGKQRVWMWRWESIHLSINTGRSFLPLGSKEDTDTDSHPSEKFQTLNSFIQLQQGTKMFLFCAPREKMPWSQSLFLSQ